METFPSSKTRGDSDSALVAAAKRGDIYAFEELVHRHKRKVLAAALRITNNREDAEDVMQECFHKVFLHLGGFRGKSQFSTWMVRIAMNEAFMLLRRRRGESEVLPESFDDGETATPEVFVDQRPSPEESCWRRERSKLLTKAINRLGPKTRTTILLCNIEERSLEETARILGTTIGAVKARVFHARRKLRRSVNPALLFELYPAGRVGAQRP
jgi:RNA polymerase sigma-70 factor (ECF subfamily)